MRREEELERERATMEPPVTLINEFKRSLRFDRKIIVTGFVVIMIIVIFNSILTLKVSGRADTAVSAAKDSSTAARENAKIVSAQADTIQKLSEAESHQTVFENEVRNLIICGSDRVCIKSVLDRISEEAVADSKTTTTTNSPPPPTTTTTIKPAGSSTPTTSGTKSSSTTTTTSNPGTTTTTTAVTTPPPPGPTRSTLGCIKSINGGTICI